MTVMKKQFGIPDTTKCEIWQRGLDKKNDKFNDLEQTVEDAKLLGGQVS